jgi:hypothetical protein
MFRRVETTFCWTTISGTRSAPGSMRGCRRACLRLPMSPTAPGFTDSGGPEHLPGHTTVNLSVGKSFGEKMSLAITAVNGANSHLLIDNSLTFGGTLFNNPREVYGEVRYRSHY